MRCTTECTIYDVIGNLSFLLYDLMNLLWHLNDYSVYQQCYTVFGHKSKKILKICNNYFLYLTQKVHLPPITAWMHLLTSKCS